MKSRQRSTGTARLIGTTLVLAAGVGMIGWYIWRLLPGTHTNDDTEESTRQTERGKVKRRRGRPVCIVITETILKLNDLSVTKILEEGVVLLVAPEVNFYNTDEQLREIDQSVVHRIIHCDTTVGIWTCLKSLHPNDLVIALGDFNENMPREIQNYVSRVHNVDSDTASLRRILDEKVVE